MGYGTRPGRFGYTIQTFWPDDTDNEIYISSDDGKSLQEIIEIAMCKWPDIDFSELSISSQKIHTNHLGYDFYDSSDYTEFIILRKIE
jgi:hypothetical protein